MVNRFLTIAALFLAPLVSMAQAVNGGMTGSFYNPELSGTGINIEVLDNQRAVGYWYTYDLGRYQMWLVLDGQINGNEISGKLYYSDGMRFGEWNPDNANAQEFGDFQITYSDCNNLDFEFDSDFLDYDDRSYPSGSISMERLTTPIGIGEQCGSDASADRSEFGGIYEGEAVSEQAGQASATTGVVSETGEAWFITEGALILGQLTSQQSSATGRFAAVALFGQTFPDGSNFGVMDVNISRTGSGLAGSYATYSLISGNMMDSGSFDLDYDSIYEGGLSHSELAGTWTSSAGAEFEIGQNGMLFGVDSEGCRYDGTVSPVDERFSVAQGKAAVSNCGSFAGFLEMVVVKSAPNELVVAFSSGPVAGTTTLFRD